MAQNRVDSVLPVWRHVRTFGACPRCLFLAPLSAYLSPSTELQGALWVFRALMIFLVCLGCLSVSAVCSSRHWHSTSQLRPSAGRRGLFLLMCRCVAMAAGCLGLGLRRASPYRCVTRSWFWLL